jgi:hypothetical protein
MSIHSEWGLSIYILRMAAFTGSSNGSIGTNTSKNLPPPWDFVSKPKKGGSRQSLVSSRFLIP